MTRPLILLTLLLSTAAHAADMGDIPGGGQACIPYVVSSDLMTTWDFLVAPTSALQMHGFRLAHTVRTAVINDGGALPVVLGLPFAAVDAPAVATGLGRAACVCTRAGSTAYSTAIRRAAETRGPSFSGAFNAALSQCLHPVPHFGGPRTGTYGNVSPTRIGVPNS